MPAFLCVSQEEIGYTASHNTVGKSFQVMIEATSEVQTAAIFFLVKDLKFIFISIHTASNL